ncbi:MAG TPA: transposase [Burkholderiales bacterium]|nr:transposase [Burkholderiales bacterium]
MSLHVVQRGHNRQACFQQDLDYLLYLKWLGNLVGVSGCVLHAYCLMTNHVHLLITPSSEGSCATLMRNLGQRYAQYFNRRYERRGSLWEGRFRSCLVDSPRYVLACQRYIELNPVRAGMVASASDYRWSSHNGNCGRIADRFLTPHATFLALGEGADDRRRYQELFGEADDPGFLAAVRDATNGGFALVGEELKSTLEARTGRHLERRKRGPAPTTNRSAGTSGERDFDADLGLRPQTG